MGNNNSNLKGKKVINTKLETASKTGILNLSEQDLKVTSTVWNKLNEEIFRSKLKTLDISNNNLRSLPIEIYNLTNLKTLHASKCQLFAIHKMNHMNKLTTLHLNHNNFCTNDGSNSVGSTVNSKSQSQSQSQSQSESESESEVSTDSNSTLQELPTSLTTLILSYNNFINFPNVLIPLVNLTILDISNNKIISIIGIGNLNNLIELFLDNNQLVELPNEVSNLKKLRKISIKHNLLTDNVNSTDSKTSSGKKQCLPEEFLVSTVVDHIDLDGNRNLTKAQVLKYKGMDVFLERRKVTKSKNFQGGALDDNALFGIH